MRRLLYASASIIALTAAANAADMYVPAPAGPGGYKDVPFYPVWAGFYVGGHVGAAWGEDKIKDVDNLNGGASYSIQDTAVIGGGQIGYNWQGMWNPQLVLGVEADIGGIGLHGQKFDPNFIGGTFSGLESGLYGDVTGRIGYSFGQALAYAKGGFAFYDGDAFVDNHLGGFGGGRAKTPDTFTGWTVGGGLEFLFIPAWSVKAEYQHFDFGSQNATLITPANGNFRYSNHLTADSVTAGVNYHFGSVYAPLK